MMKNIDLDLSHIADGGLQEKLDGEMVKVFENIHDPNTEAKTKRKVTITLEFQPDEDRELVIVNSQIRLNLAPVKGVNSKILTGINGKGEVEAHELESGVKGQTYYDVEDETFKTDIGEPIEDIEKSSNVVDLQKKQG
jgi:hypothetical protein